jgi:hypothetical protein
VHTRNEEKALLSFRVEIIPHFINALTQDINMQSIAQVQNVQKINAVSTGKVANEKSMMVWRPHGNK